MPPEEATYHMKRCVDSGLWVPDAKKEVPDETQGDSNEGTYATVENVS